MDADARSGSAGSSDEGARAYQGHPPTGPGASSSAAGDTGRGSARASDSPASAVADAVARLREVKEYATYFISAKWDAIKILLRNVTIFAALGLLGMVIGATVLVMAVVLFLWGAAAGLGMLFPDRYWWLGPLLLGFLILGGTVAGVFVGMKILTNASRKRTIKKYESRQRQQRADYGHDVHERATS